jgi:DNA-binding PadR family transcriptional regulator
MIGFRKNSTEDVIVSLFLEKKYNAQSLQKQLKKQGHKISLASLYDQLHKLLEKQILFKTGTFYSLNAEWLQYMQDLLTPKNEYILDLGEKLRYQLSSLSRAEQYWKHIMHSLYVSYPDEPVFMYNPHSFWSLIPGRKESEDTYVQHHEKNKRYMHYVLGGTTVHDINLRKQYSAQFYKVDIKEINQFKRNEYVTVIGDLVFTMSIPLSLAKKIDQLYIDVQDHHALVFEIAELEKHSWRISSKIENNPKKAQLLRQRIGKQFLSRSELDIIKTT